MVANRGIIFGISRFCGLRPDFPITNSLFSVWTFIPVPCGPSLPTFILGDPGADSGGKGKTKRAEKMARRKVKNGAIFFRPFSLSLAPTICPWVSEDDPRSNPRCVFWQTSYPKWSLAPQQIVQQLRTFLDDGVLGPLGSLRSASCQQPQLTWLCIYLASFKLLLLRLRSRQPCTTTGGHMTLLVSSLQRSTSFHKKFWNLPDGEYRIRNPTSRR